MWISAAYIEDTLDLFRRMLVGMAVREMGTLLQRGKDPATTFAPAVNMTVRMAAYSGLGYTIFLTVQNQGLPIPGGLCYLVHSE